MVVLTSTMHLSISPPSLGSRATLCSLMLLSHATPRPLQGDWLQMDALSRLNSITLPFLPQGRHQQVKMDPSGHR